MQTIGAEYIWSACNQTNMLHDQNHAWKPFSLQCLHFIRYSLIAEMIYERPTDVTHGEKLNLGQNYLSAMCEQLLPPLVTHTHRHMFEE